MDNGKAVRPIIIRRKKVMAAAHHGGAWKVAYADFVTAMMAFFLLMWLLSVTDEKTKLGLADYFSPTIPIFSTSGGGDGPFDGSSMFSQDTLAQDETGQTGDPAVEDTLGSSNDALDDIAQALQGSSGDAVDADPLLQHIRTRLTDEGLIIEVFDVKGSPLFVGQTLEPTPIFERLLDMIGRVLSRIENKVAVTGHLAREDIASDGVPAEGIDPWRLSGDRAQLTRSLLVDAGVGDARIARVTGKSDREPASEVVGDSRNRRIEITLLRSFRE